MIISNQILIKIVRACLSDEPQEVIATYLYQFMNEIQESDVETKTKLEFQEILNALIRHDHGQLIKKLFAENKEFMLWMELSFEGMINASVFHGKHAAVIELIEILLGLQQPIRLDFLKTLILYLTKTGEMRLLDKLLRSTQEQSALIFITLTEVICQQISNVEVYHVLEKHGVELRVEKLHRAVSYHAKNDTLISHLIGEYLNDNSLVEYFDADEELKFKLFEELLKYNHIKSVKVLIEFNQGKYLNDFLPLIKQAKTMLIQSSEMFSLFQAQREEANLVSETYLVNAFHNCFYLDYLDFERPIFAQAHRNELEHNLMFISDEVTNTLKLLEQYISQLDSLSSKYPASHVFQAIVLIAVKINAHKLASCMIKKYLSMFDLSALHQIIQAAREAKNLEIIKDIIRHANLQLLIILIKPYILTVNNQDILIDLNLADSPLVTAIKMAMLNGEKIESDVLEKLTDAVSALPKAYSKQFMLLINAQETDQTVKVGATAESYIPKYYGGGVSQTQFKAFSLKIIHLISTALKHKSFKVAMSNQDSRSLTLHHLCEMRKRIAVQSNSLYAERFGMLRKDTGDNRDVFATPLIDHYKPFLDEFLQDVIPTLYNDPCFQWVGYQINRGVCGIKGSTVMQQDGERIVLTRYELLHDPDSGCIQPFWIHPLAKDIPLLLKKIDHLIGKLTNSPIDRSSEEQVSSLIERVAEIHWLVQTNPAYRGSEAIFEWIIGGIFQFHGFDVELLAMMGCRALIEPNKEKYIKTYSNYVKLTPITTPDMDFATIFENTSNQPDPHYDPLTNLFNNSMSTLTQPTKPSKQP